MIFVTVGTQLAFDRLVSAVDYWNESNQCEVFAQVGPNEYVPKNMQYSQFVDPSKADQLFKTADLIISHAGMGSILTALRHQKPIIIMPRVAALGEHRNDHQLATCKWLGGTSGITVAKDEKHLHELLVNRNELNSGNQISPFASNELINHLKTFFNSH